MFIPVLFGLAAHRLRIEKWHMDKTHPPQAFVRPAKGTVMVFGFDPQDKVLAQVIAPDTSVLHRDGAQITAEGMAQNNVICAVMSLFPLRPVGQNDAISVIEALVAAGYRGEVLVLAPPLLRPKMVENELRGLAKGMQTRLLAGVLPPLSDI